MTPTKSVLKNSNVKNLEIHSFHLQEMTFQINRKNGDASVSRVVKPQNEYVHLVSKVRRIVDI